MNKLIATYWKEESTGKFYQIGGECTDALSGDKLVLFKETNPNFEMIEPTLVISAHEFFSGRFTQIDKKMLKGG